MRLADAAKVIIVMYLLIGVISVAAQVGIIPVSPTLCSFSIIYAATAC